MLRARGIGVWGKEKNRRSEERAFDPVRKGVEVKIASKIATEVEVKIAWPLGRRRGKISTRELDREESGKQ